MSSCPLPLGDDEALVVLGSENWNAADRHLGRGRIRSAQVLTTDGVTQLRHLDSLGARGLRDIVFVDDDTVVITTGHALFRFRIRSGTVDNLMPDHVSDIHELALRGRTILFANTAMDEAIEVDVDSGAVTRRGLEAFRHSKSQAINHQRPLGGAIPVGPKQEWDDHFHANQYVDGHGDSALVVVHHVGGFRPMRAVGKRLVGHGDGGVLDLTNGDAHGLGLRAPHSLRRLADGGYVVFDSGRGEGVVLDGQFAPMRRFDVGGWGRGCAVVDDERWFVGLSALRKRYNSGGESSLNSVVSIDPESGKRTADWVLDDVEQIWSVSVVQRSVAELMGFLTARVA